MSTSPSTTPTDAENIKSNDAVKSIDLEGGTPSDPGLKSAKSNEINKETTQRTSWDNPIEFLFSCISMSVGLGNIWRFPFVTYENGGGAFLIPYLLVLAFIGRPVYFLEMVIGQFASYGSVKIWTLSPFFKGVGLMGMIAVTVVTSYYNTICATTLYYLAVSFQKTLPWTVCDPSWKDCFNCTYSDCSQLYYDKTVTESYLHINNGLGAPLWKLTLCLLAAWTMTFVSLVNGVQSSGKVAYFTAIFPYLVLIIFLIRGVTLEGAKEGVIYFIRPNWSKLLEPKVWHAAVGQCFFSLGTGQGTITMLSSYNKFRNKAYRDALIVSIMDTFTSLLGGFTIFAVLGHLSFLTGKPIGEVTEGGPGLAFVSYPAAISKFPGAPQFFSVLFFLMLLTLGIGSANGLTETVMTIAADQFPNVKRWIIALTGCITGFVLGIIFVTPGGQFMVTFIDFYGSGFILFLSCTLEITAVAWFYGVNNFVRDIEFMLKIKVGWYWKISWGIIIPCGLSLIFLYTLIKADTLKHNGVEFPVIATAFGWTLSVFAFLSLPICGAIAVYRATGNTWSEKFLNSFYPNEKWGPFDPVNRQEWLLFKKYSETETRIPVSDKREIILYIRGDKEKISVKYETDTVTITIVQLPPDSKIVFKNMKTRVIGFFYKVFGWMSLKWIVSEGEYERFLITVKSAHRIIKNHEWEKSDDGVLVIVFHF